MADYQVWHALHDQCPPEGCGKCVTVEIDLDDDDLELVAATGEDLDVFLHRAVVAGMKADGWA